MSEHPIMFTAPMVRAILAGTKTQTRRIVKPLDADHVFPFIGADNERTGEWAWCRSPHVVTKHIRCPYGVPGDRLWVLERVRAHELTDKEAKEDTYGVIERLGLESPLYGLDGVIYEADGTFREIEATREAAEQWDGLYHQRGKKGSLVPSRSMPKWASRIKLELTDVRVQRVQDIGDADALDEGCPRGEVNPNDPDDIPIEWRPRAWFETVWDQINSKRADWASNPLVWALTFRRVS